MGEVTVLDWLILPEQKRLVSQLDRYFMMMEKNYKLYQTRFNSRRTHERRSEEMETLLFETLQFSD